MPLTIACQCGQHYAVEDQYAGQRVSCPMCNRIIDIPRAAPSPVHPSYSVPDFDLGEPPARGSGMIALILTFFVIFVFAGGLIGFVVWLSRQDGEQVASTDPSPVETSKREKPKEKPAPPTPSPQEKPKQQEPKQPPPVKVDEPPPAPRPAKKTLPPPSDRPWQGHLAPNLAVAIEPGGKSVWTAAGGDEDSSLRRWDATSGKESGRLDFMDAGLAVVAFDADAKRAAIASPKKSTIEVWDLVAKKKLATLDGHLEPITALAFSPDGKRLVSAGEDKLVLVWDASAGKMLHKMTGHTNSITGITVAPDGQQALTGSMDLSARLWDLDKGQQLRELSGHGDIVWAVAYSRDGKLALTGGGMQKLSADLFVAGARDHQVRCWDLDTHKEKKRFSPLAGPVTALAFSPDGRRFLAGGNDGDLRLWQMDRDRESKRLDGHSGKVRAVAFFPEGRRAISASDDKTFRVWELPADLPDLVRDLESGDANTRLDALAGLAKLGEETKPAIRALFDALKRPQKDWRERVLTVLRSLSPLDKEHVLQLDRLLRDKSFTEGRLFALDELAALGPAAKPSAKSVLTAIGDDDVEIKRKALTALVPMLDEVAKEAFEPLLMAMRDKDATVRQQAEKALDKLGAPSADRLTKLRDLLGEREVPLKRYALRSLGGLGKAAEPALADISARATLDSSSEVRQLGIEALGKIAPRDPTTIAAAAKGLDDVAAVARSSAKVLAAANDVTGLLLALDHLDDEVSKTADEGLSTKKVRFTAKQVPALTKLLESKRPEVRNRAVESLAGLGEDAADAVPALCKVLKASDGDEQKEILASLSKMGKAASAAGPAVAELLKTKDRERHLAICKVLIEIEAKEVSKAFASLVAQLRPEKTDDIEDEEATKQRERARELLVQMGKAAQKETLKTLLVVLVRAMDEDFKGGRGAAALLNATARLAVVKSLGEMGSQAKNTEVMRVLSAARSDVAEGVREAARKAYLLVQRKE